MRIGIESQAKAGSANGSLDYLYIRVGKEGDIQFVCWPDNEKFVALRVFKLPKDCIHSIFLSNRFKDCAVNL